MENSITVVGLRQNVLVLQAHAVFEIRMERYGNILRARTLFCDFAYLIGDYVADTNLLLHRHCAKYVLPNNNTQYMGTV